MWTRFVALGVTATGNCSTSPAEPIRYAKRYPEARVDAFIEDMRAAYYFADLVICRAGATTIAELTAIGNNQTIEEAPESGDVDILLLIALFVIGLFIIL